MTTVATDGKSMAADGYATSRDIIAFEASPKVEKLKDGTLAGGAGCAGLVDQYIAWLDGGREGERPSLKDSRLLILKPNGRLFMFDDTDLEMEISAPFAIGSGGEIAIGAMDAGATAREAVEIAARRDPWTGGKITEIKLCS